MMPTAYGMLLDRGLTLDQLNLAFEVAFRDPDPATNRKSLTVALRDIVSDQEAENKTKKCLTHVWLNPPAQAAGMIAWATVLDAPRQSRQVLHFGALLATFPFAGAVARVIGQHFQTDGRAEARLVRAEVRRIVGDRSAVDIAARKAYTTFRNIGVIQQRGQSLEPVETPLSVPAELTGWMGHAILLTRNAESLPASSVRNAPELLGVTLTTGGYSDYPFIEFHSQGDDQVLVRMVATGVAEEPLHRAK